MYIFIFFSITYIALYIVSGVEYIEKNKIDAKENNVKLWGILLLKFIFLLVSFFYIFSNIENDINMVLSYLLFTFPILISYMEKMNIAQDNSNFIKISYGIGMLFSGIGLAICIFTFSNIRLLQMEIINKIFLSTMFINLVLILSELILSYISEEKISR